MVRALQKEWMKLCTTITQKEVSRAVHQCITKDLLILNDPLNRFFDIVENVYRHGCYEPVEHRVVEYEVEHIVLSNLYFYCRIRSLYYRK